MFRCMLKAAGVLLLGALLLDPFAASAFEAVDTLTRSSGGQYPAYGSEPIPPYELWAQFGTMYDTNLLRRTTGDNSELVTRLGTGGRWDGRIAGRQGLHVDGEVDAFVYNKFSDLDNIAYRGLAEWRYQVGNDLAGGIGYSRRKFQAALNEIQRAQYDPITEQRFFANGRYALGPHLGFRAGWDLLDYHRPARDFSETQTIITMAGLDYITDLGNIIGVEARNSHGNAPVNQLVDPLGQFVNNDFTQHDFAVIWTYVAGPQLRFAGNVGRTTRTYTELPGRDFSGPTYRVAAHWAPVNKAYLDFEASKHVSSIIDIGAAHVVVKGFAFGPGWALTAKTNIQARFLRQNLTYGGDPEAQLGVVPLREEIIHAFRLGTYWEYSRQVHITAAWEQGNRDSNVLGRNYRFNAYMANIRYVF